MGLVQQELINMTVKEMIKYLQNCNPESYVTIDLCANGIGMEQCYIHVITHSFVIVNKGYKVAIEEVKR